MQGYRGLAATSPAAAARLVPIFITVDPERDTPAVLKSYVSAFGPQLIGLTGSPQRSRAAAKEYGVYFHRQVAPAGASAYLVDHSSQVILFGPDGAADRAGADRPGRQGRGRHFRPMGALR